jgi:ADP-ribose pyrophosphatase
MHIKKIEQLTHEKWLNLFSAEFEHNGHGGQWLYASRKPQPNAEREADAVIIVPILRADGEPPRLVMVEEFRVPIGDYVLSFPAGLLDHGESIEETARRELLEETGLDIASVQRVTQPLYSSSGVTDEAVALAFVEARATPQTKPKLEASEDLQVLLLDFAAVCRLCDDRSARIDARAWAVLHMYQQLGRLP